MTSDSSLVKLDYELDNLEKMDVAIVLHPTRIRLPVILFGEFSQAVVPG